MRKIQMRKIQMRKIQINKELTLKRVKIKNKGTFLICRETKEIFTLEDRKLVGSIIDDEFIFD